MQRLDKLTLEEARMAAMESLSITHGIDERLEVVDGKVREVDLKVVSVVQGELYTIHSPPNLFSAPPG